MMKMENNECHLFRRRTLFPSLRFIVSLLLSLYEDKRFITINVMYFFNKYVVKRLLQSYKKYDPNVREEFNSRHVRLE